VSYYRELTPRQEPYDMGPDNAGLARVGFNLDAVKRPGSDTYADEVRAYLIAGQIIAARSILVGSAGDQPDGTTAFLLILESPGVNPLRTHNSVSTPAYQRPTLEIIAKGKSYSSCMSLARRAYDRLVGVRNATISA
jgi:hypothetical protein